MPRKKRTRPTKSQRIDVVAHERLEQLQQALGSQSLPTYVMDYEILSALVLYTTPEQLAGMLRAYWQYTDDLPDQEDG